MLKWRDGKTLRVLDFDIENRPLSYLGMDYTTGEVTAIAASWEGKQHVWVKLLGRNTALEMLAGFAELYNQADIVTGHYIRKHDLPVLNGAMLEHGLPPLRNQDMRRLVDTIDLDDVDFALNREQIEKFRTFTP